MQITGAPPWATLGAAIALVVLILAILGVVGVLPQTTLIVFGLIALLAIARLT